MQILADENVPGPVVGALRLRGHDVVWVRELSPGMRDEAVLALSGDAGRLLLTWDKDFGELIFRRRLPCVTGVVLIRLTAPSPEFLATRVATLLEARTDWIGRFSVVDDRRVRMNDLPE